MLLVAISIRTTSDSVEDAERRVLREATGSRDAGVDGGGAIAALLGAIDARGFFPVGMGTTGFAAFGGLFERRVRVSPAVTDVAASDDDSAMSFGIGAFPRTAAAEGAGFAFLETVLELDVCNCSSELKLAVFFWAAGGCFGFAFDGEVAREEDFLGSAIGGEASVSGSFEASSLAFRSGLLAEERVMCRLGGGTNSCCSERLK